MSFDRTQQQQQQNPERVTERATSYHASRRMSDEAHVHDLNFRPREERQRPFLQNAVYRESDAAAEVIRTVRHGRSERGHERQSESHDSGWRDSASAPRKSG